MSQLHNSTLSADFGSNLPDRKRHVADSEISMALEPELSDEPENTTSRFRNMVQAGVNAGAKLPGSIGRRVKRENSAPPGGRPPGDDFFEPPIPMTGIYHLPATATAPMTIEQKVSLYRILATDVMDGDLIRFEKLSRNEQKRITAILKESVEKAESLFATTALMSALFLAINLSVLLIDVVADTSESDYNNGFMLAFRICIFLSTGSNFLGLWFSTRWYLYLSSWCVDEMAQLFFIANANVGTPIAYMMAGAGFILLSMPLSARVFYDTEQLIISSVCVMLTVIHIVAVEFAWYHTFLKNFERRLDDLPGGEAHRRHFDYDPGHPLNTRLAQLLGLDVVFRELRISLIYFQASPGRRGLRYTAEEASRPVDPFEQEIPQTQTPQT